MVVDTKVKSNGRRVKKAKQLIKLDLACGQNKQEGHVGVDVIGAQGVDVVLDLFGLNPWPWEDESVEEIFCSHFLEHIPHSQPNEPIWYHFWNECYRVLIPGGKMRVISPYYSSMRAVQDPAHVRSICDATFLYLWQDWIKQNKLDHYPVHCNFQFQCSYTISNQEYMGRNPEYTTRGVKYYFNVVDDLVTDLTKLPMP